MRSRRATLAVVGVSVVCLALPAVAQPTARLEARGGVRAAVFDTLHGTVTVNLPDDAAAGDTIGGRVSVEPAGDTEEERRESADRLSGLVVDAEGAETDAGGDLSWTIPATLAGTAAALVLRDREGRSLGAVEVPVGEPAPGASELRLPDLGQTGRPVAVPGPFDGRLGTTGVRVGGRDAVVLAESPRQVVFESPAGVVGPTEIEVREGETRKSGSYRSVALDLSAPKTVLDRGESTTVTVRVRGLEGLETPIPLELVNETPGVVTLERGNVQSHDVRPEDVGEGGEFVLTQRVTSLQPGGFALQASLLLSLHTRELSRLHTERWSTNGHLTGPSTQHGEAASGRHVVPLTNMHDVAKSREHGVEASKGHSEWWSKSGHDPVLSRAGSEHGDERSDAHRYSRSKLHRESDSHHGHDPVVTAMHDAELSEGGGHDDERSAKGHELGRSNRHSAERSAEHGEYESRRGHDPIHSAAGHSSSMSPRHDEVRSRHNVFLTRLGHDYYRTRRTHNDALSGHDEETTDQMHDEIRSAEHARAQSRKHSEEMSKYGHEPIGSKKDG